MALMAEGVVNALRIVLNKSTVVFTIRELGEFINVGLVRGTSTSHDI